MADHLDHLAVLAAELAEDGAQLLGFFAFHRALAGLQVPQERYLVRGVVVNEAEGPLPDLHLRRGGHGVRAAAARGAQAEKEVR